MMSGVDGYFAAPGSGGLSLYALSACRLLDTRSASGGQVFSGTLPVRVVGSSCSIPANAQAGVFNATVVPPGAFPYLTLWPDGQTQPGVSALNAYDGAVTSSLAITTAPDGYISAFAANRTHLILDIVGYFAP
jgi:hypothetical protein